MNIEDLRAPFGANEILYRVGATNKDKTSGMALYYMDGRAVDNRLDDVVGYKNWQVRYPFVGCCELGIKVDGEWLWKANGAGETDFEGIKGQYSDAKKRAATEWGIGRYLYAADSKWYPCKLRGKSAVFTDVAISQIKSDYITWVKGYSWQIDPAPVREQRIRRAVQRFTEILLADTEDVDTEAMQEIETYLSNDERIYVLNAFGDELVPNTKRLYRTIIKDCLKWKPADEVIQ